MLTRESKFWLRCGALLGGLAVALGAFAAHGLGDVLAHKYAGVTKQVLGEEVPAARKYLADFKTAAEYQMYHSLALLVVGLLPVPPNTRSRSLAGWSFLLGIVFFSGSLYALVLTGVTMWGAITPIGGVLYIVGWLALLAASVKIAFDSPGNLEQS